jgi:hypothetical protein
METFGSCAQEPTDLFPGDLGGNVSLGFGFELGYSGLLGVGRTAA